MHNAFKIGGVVFGFLAGILLIWVVWSFVGGSQWATAQVDERLYTFRLASNPLKQARGLSGMTIGQLQSDGMLFSFDDESARTFSMRGMQFNLDIIWVRDNKIVDIDYNIPAPLNGATPVRVNSNPLLVDMVIEVPAGNANEMNFQIGHVLTIDLDASAGK